MTVVVIPAGGAGARRKSRQPKQYLRVTGAPLLVHTLRALLRSGVVDGVVLAVPGDRIVATRRMLQRYRVPRILGVVGGGANRQESVWRGLQAAPAGARC